MLRVKAVTERQVLIEEIYDELEGLLLGAHGASPGEDEEEEEEDGCDIIEFPKTRQEGSESQTGATKRSPSPRTKNNFSNLLADLLKTQKMLQRGLDRLGKLLEQQS
jgi:hypothetical protein